jgi:hypothetical protein
MEWLEWLELASKRIKFELSLGPVRLLASSNLPLLKQKRPIFRRAFLYIFFEESNRCYKSRLVSQNYLLVNSG